VPQPHLDRGEQVPGRVQGQVSSSDVLGRLLVVCEWELCSGVVLGGLSAESNVTGLQAMD
jgi:hypothetical protein